MAVSKYKERIMITLPKKQAAWLKEFTKKHDITISHYISWLLYYKADEMLRILKIDDSSIYTAEELRKIITEVKWIEDK